MKQRTLILVPVLFLCACIQESTQETQQEAPYVPCESVCQEWGHCFLAAECSCEKSGDSWESCSKNGMYAETLDCCFPTAETCKNSDMCRIAGECTLFESEDWKGCYPGSNMDCMLSELCGPDLTGPCIYCPELGSACIGCPTDYAMCQQYC